MHTPVPPRTVALLGTLGVLAACQQSSSTQGYLSASVLGDMRYAQVDRVAASVGLHEACGAGGATAVGERGMPRWPYLQKVTHDSAELLFTSDTDRDFRILVTTPAGDTIAEVDAVADTTVRPSQGTQYVASLPDLPAGQIVCWQLQAGNEAWTRPTGFRTAPDPASDATIRFLAFGDLGTQQSDQYAVFDAMQDVSGDFVLVTGDVVYKNGTPSEIDRNFFQVYRPMLGEVPFFVASGNHDYNTDDARPFRDAFSLFENGGPEGKERWYSFDWGPVHFVMLDTEKVGPTQAKWLEADLAAHDRPWVVGVEHRPPYSSGSHGSDRNVRETFGPIFEAHDVPLVLVGHDHHYERTTPQNGVVYVVTGGGGRGTREVGESDFTAVSDRVAHFLFLEASAEHLRAVAIDATGKAFDSVGFHQP
jgi:hypothetical protein